MLSAISAQRSVCADATAQLPMIKEAARTEEEVNAVGEVDVALAKLSKILSSRHTLAKPSGRQSTVDDLLAQQAANITMKRRCNRWLRQCATKPRKQLHYS